MSRAAITLGVTRDAIKKLIADTIAKAAEQGRDNCDVPIEGLLVEDFIVNEFKQDGYFVHPDWQNDDQNLHICWSGPIDY